MVFFLKSPKMQLRITMKTQPAKAGSAFRQIGADMQKLSVLADLLRPARSLWNVLIKNTVERLTCVSIVLG